MTRAQHRTPNLVPPAVVRAAIARALLGRDAMAGDATMGTVALRPHQLDAASRLRTILQRDHVALLADDVGMGKTFTALAVSRDYVHTVIIAPAALLPMWRDAISRAAAVGIQVFSVQHFSRAASGCGEQAASCDASGRWSGAFPAGTLVIIDEAHHLRTPTTQRYRAVSALVSGCDLLLVSATPVHNSPRDLRALLALALGSQASALDDRLLARLVVRRTDVVRRPRITRRPPIPMPHDPSILDAILALPAPLPAHDGAVAGALIRLGLLRAWCSSDAALDAALRKRLLRGEALLQALESGRHPTTAELRSWLVGEHEVQLAFPELLAGHSPESGALLEILSRHLAAVRTLREHARGRADPETRRGAGDVARVERLRAMMAEHGPVPIVAFSQFAETVRAVGRALADIAGVGVMTGQRAWIASGAISRQEALASFAPDAQGRPPPADHQRIRLLLTTDLLAEGVNLQDAGVVVHLDLPWTAALRRQRVGRCARDGSKHLEVVVYEFAPPPSAESALRLYARLVHKARVAARLVGSAQSRAIDASRRGGPEVAARRVRIRGADAATAMRVILSRWREYGAREPADNYPLRWQDAPSTGRRSTPLCAIVPSSANVGLALLSNRSGDQVLLALAPGRSHTGQPRWRVSLAPARLLDYLRQAGNVPHTPAASPQRPHAAWPSVYRALRRWCRRRALRAELGDDDAISSVIHRRAHDVLRQRIGRLSPSQRSPLRPDVHRVVEMLSGVRGAAAEEALRRWIASSDEPTARWLTSWRAYPALTATVRHEREDQATHTRVRETATSNVAASESAYRVSAVLLLVADT